MGATGLAQVLELTERIQCRSGRRQGEGARFGLAHNGRGNIGINATATVVAILGQA